jgi:hypothetical protein
MRIKYPELETKKLEDLERGAVFQLSPMCNVFIKSESTGDDGYFTCIDLGDGSITDYHNSADVIVSDCELIVKT